jgi:hypothetical protein
VPKFLVNSLLSFLMLLTLVWGGCVSCDEYFMWPGAKSCCQPNGRCKAKKSQAPQKPGRACNQLAYDQQSKLDLHVELPAVPAIAISDLLSPLDPVNHFRTETIEPSPPDLEILNSTFLV